VSFWHLKDEAYGVQIRKKIIELTGSIILFGTLYNTLDSLVKKGYVAYCCLNLILDGAYTDNKSNACKSGGFVKV